MCPSYDKIFWILIFFHKFINIFKKKEKEIRHGDLNGYLWIFFVKDKVLRLCWVIFLILIKNIGKNIVFNFKNERN